MNIRIYIDRLVLDGLPISRPQGALVQAVIESELARLFTESGAVANLKTSTAVPSARADAIQINHGSTPTQIGTQIAQSIYSGIGKI